MGWRPSLPDQRDFYHRFAGAKIAPEVDLRKTGFLPDIWDQGQLGSCTAFGVSAAYSFDQAMQGGERNFGPSELFVYYNTRILEGTLLEDSGATITNAVKSLNKYGAAPQADWPYDIKKFAQVPPSVAYTHGELRQAVKYARVSQTTQAMQACLTAGTPIVVGFTVYESFESDAANDTGDVPMPQRGEQLYGGHCVLVVGYTMRAGKPVWIARNSWGTGWGDAGYFYFPQQYLLSTSLSDDFWTVQSVESPDPAPVPPTPQPQPAPVPLVADVADKTLWGAAGFRDWAYARHIGPTKAAATAVKQWAKDKGLAT